MNFFRSYAIALALGTVLLTAGVWAQDNTDSVEDEAEEPQSEQKQAEYITTAGFGTPGTVVRPTDGNIPLRLTPPDSFRLPGRTIQQIDEEAIYVILDARVVPFFFTYNQWIRVASVEIKKNDVVGFRDQDTRGAWAYWGRSGTNSSYFDTLSIDPQFDESVRRELSQWSQWSQ